jgi:hypothetical protein
VGFLDVIIMTQETQVLQNIIENYISKKIDLVRLAQKYSAKILDYGFIETEKTLPFQILPSEFMDSEGNVICKMYVNLEHPLYGMFTIELLEDQCAVTCPNIYKTDFFVSTHDEFEKWLDILDSEMNEFYILSNAATENNINYCILFLNEIIGRYKENINIEIKKIKSIIDNEERAAIVSNQIYALASKAQKDYSKALLMPSAWVIFKSLNNLPDDGEDFSDYIDDKATEQLFLELQKFFRIENYLAAPVYLAQRICLQSNLIIEGYSETEQEWHEAAISEEFGEFVLPPIDISKFEIKFSN